MENNKDQDIVYVYHFDYKGVDGKLSFKLIDVESKNCDIAIEKFEKLYPEIVWREVRPPFAISKEDLDAFMNRIKN